MRWAAQEGEAVLSTVVTDSRAAGEDMRGFQCLGEKRTGQQAKQPAFPAACSLALQGVPKDSNPALKPLCRFPKLICELEKCRFQVWLVGKLGQLLAFFGVALISLGKRHQLPWWLMFR
jgi:hypothetical protein